MSQHDFNIANQGFPSFRTDLNNALVALATTSSGTAEPATTYANQLWYETDTNTLHIRDEANAAWLDLMVINQTTGSPSFNAGNVGIGTSSPQEKLVVEGASPFILVNNTDETRSGIRFADVQNTSERFQLAFDASPAAMCFDRIESTGVVTERMRIDSSGNVGIGTSSPDGNLTVGSTTTSGDISVRIKGDATSRGFLMFGDAGGAQLGDIMYDHSTDHMRFRVNNSERMRIDSSGNVGIGTSSPVVSLHVVGDTMTTGVVYKNQPAQVSKAAAATLTIAELVNGIIQYTGAAATLTLPTGTLIEGGLPATFPVDMSFDFSVINTGTGTVTLGTATGLTLVGAMTTAISTSTMFRVRKTATNAYTVYRIS